jgi:choline dehydrogenase-like flavoprotein
MHVDATGAPPGDLTADVCIVGAGPAGITLAQELSRRGLQVLLLESGGRTVEDFSTSLNEGDSVGRPIFRLHESRLRAFGGTSNHWLDNSYRSRPFDPIDFEQRAGLPHSGWPVRYTDLVGYYQRASEVSGLTGVPFDDEDFGDPLDPTLRTAWRGLLRPTVFRIGVGSPDFFTRYFGRFERDPNVTVVLHATVVDLELDEHHRTVRSVQVARPDGSRFRASARAVVLAAGGIENPRILLLNQHKRRGGLGNEFGAVGRFFQEHLHLVVGMLRLTDHGWRARLASADRDVPGAPGVRYRHTLTIDPDVLRARELYNAAFYLAPVVRDDAGAGLQSWRQLRTAIHLAPRPSDVGWHAANVARRPQDLLQHAVRRARRDPGPELDVLEVTAIAEQAPNPASRVTLGSRRDVFGQRRAVLDWRTTDYDLDSVRRSVDLLDGALRQAGAGVLTNRHPELSADARADELFAFRRTVVEYHHMGTTRMAADPRDGVVDPDGRVHDTANLYVAGSSVFPTSGHANPTLTVVALAVRLADHLGDVLQTPLDLRAGHRGTPAANGGNGSAGGSSTGAAPAADSVRKPTA